jgi:hypothetical protein
VSVTIILFAINQNYLDTFISTKTGNAFIQEMFTKIEEDEKKINIFVNNKVRLKAGVKVWSEGWSEGWSKATAASRPPL